MSPRPHAEAAWMPTEKTGPAVHHTQAMFLFTAAHAQVTDLAELARHEDTWSAHGPAS